MKKRIVILCILILASTLVFAGGENEANPGFERSGFENRSDDGFEPGVSASDLFIRGMESWDDQIRGYEFLVLATETDPDFALAWFERANRELKLFDDRDAAENSLLRALEADPGFLSARFRLMGLWRWDKEREDEYAGQIEFLIEYYPEDPRAMGEVGRFFKGIGEVEAALEYLDRAVALAFESGDESLGGEYISDLAFVNNDLGNREEAIELFRVARDIQPDNTSAAVELAWLLFEQGEQNEGLEILRQAAGESWDKLFAREELARMELEAGNPEAALREAQAILDQEPGRSGARGVLGQVLLAQGDFDGASRELTAVLREKDWNPWLWSELGYAELGRRDLNAADNAFTRAVEQWGDGIPGVAGLAEVEENRGNDPAAVRVLERGIEKTGGHPVLVLRLALILDDSSSSEANPQVAVDLINEMSNFLAREGLPPADLRLLRDYIRRNPQRGARLQELLPSI